MKRFRQSKARRGDLHLCRLCLTPLFLGQHAEPKVLVHRLLQRLPGSTKALPQQRLHIIVNGQGRSHIMMLPPEAS